MREIKFRVWNGAEMVYDVTVGKFGVFYVNPANNGLDPNDSASLTPFTTKYSDGTPVMQSTGLTDKNGVEIYEGDVITDPDNFGCITGWGGGECDDFPDKKLIVWDDLEAKFKLEFLNEKYHGRGVSGYSLCKGNSMSRFEVIGSIYSNPELLKK